MKEDEDEDEDDDDNDDEDENYPPPPRYALVTPVSGGTKRKRTKRKTRRSSVKR